MPGLVKRQFLPVLTQANGLFNRSRRFGMLTHDGLNLAAALSDVFFDWGLAR